MRESNGDVLSVLGNQEADRLAKEGALLHPISRKDIIEFKVCAKQLKNLAYHMIDSLQGITAARVDGGKLQRLPNGFAIGAKIKQTTGHNFVWLKDCWICSTCFCRTSSLSSKSKRCRGPPGVQRHYGKSPAP